MQLCQQSTIIELDDVVVLLQHLEASQAERKLLEKNQK